MDKYIGRLLDNRYEILEVIGTGGMAVVYKAKCHRLNRLVAIKILKDDFLEDEEFRRRFHSESQAVAMLSHPNIISVYDVSTSITADYIVMELIDGITLKQYMEKKGVLNWKETLHFAIQIAKALEHAHSRGIVHRDIKPHNVMVLKNGSVKVTDFGIARMMSKGNTLTKEALGSVHYISPEQAKGGRVDNRSDIYSLGVVMYEMMSGRPPYDAESPVSVAIQHINGGAVMPSTLNPNIPGGLEQIIMRAMAHEPANRYSTATQMLADLDEFRKDPAILFDYNIPPTDEVTNITKPPVIPDITPTPTIAEAKANTGNAKKPAPRKPAGSSGDSRRRQSPPPKRRRREDEEEKQNKTTLIAIICCAAVIFMALLFLGIGIFSGSFSTEVEVPNLVGRNYEFVIKENHPFKIHHEEVYDDEVEAGKIVTQDPPAGTKLIRNNGTVFVEVSKGPKVDPVFMPDLKGMTKEEAKEALKKLGIQITYNEPVMESSETYEEGKVTRTDPPEGTELATKQTVTIYISTGKPIKTLAMPNVVGRKLTEAKKILNDLHLDLVLEIEEVFDAEVPKDVVISTDPLEADEIKTGQTILIQVSKGPETFDMPALVNLPYSEAYMLLQQLGYSMNKLEVVYVASVTVPQGTVLEQSVQAKEKVSSETVITLTVSSGPEATQPTQVTKERTIVFTTPPAADCEIEIRDANNNLVLRQSVTAGATQITVSLTGTGVNHYFYYFVTGTEEGDIPLAGEFEVNFNE